MCVIFLYFFIFIYSFYNQNKAVIFYLLKINETNIKIFGQQKSTLIYYLEIVARKEAEINRLRKINNELQLKVHETEKEYYHYVQLFMKLQKLTRGYLFFYYIFKK